MVQQVHSARQPTGLRLALYQSKIRSLRRHKTRQIEPKEAMTTESSVPYCLGLMRNAQVQQVMLRHLPKDLVLRDV
jgi:hypothetical protein